MAVVDVDQKSVISAVDKIVAVMEGEKNNKKVKKSLTLTGCFGTLNRQLYDYYDRAGSLRL